MQTARQLPSRRKLLQTKSTKFVKDLVHNGTYRRRPPRCSHSRCSQSKDQSNNAELMTDVDRRSCSWHKITHIQPVPGAFTSKAFRLVANNTFLDLANKLISHGQARAQALLLKDSDAPDHVQRWLGAVLRASRRNLGKTLYNETHDPSPIIPLCLSRQCGYSCYSTACCADQSDSSAHICAPTSQESRIHGAAI